MKTKYKTLGIILVGILIIPQITFASWWNPLSWNIWKIFKSEPKTEQTQIRKTTQATSTTKTVNTKPEEEIIQLKKEVEALKKQNAILPVSKQMTPTVQNLQEKKLEGKSKTIIPKLIIESISAVPSANEILFKWKTNIPSVGKLSIWPTNTPTGNLVITTKLNNIHEQIVTTAPSKKYFYIIEFTSENGDYISSEQKEVLTPTDNISPKILGVKIVNGINESVLKITIFADEDIKGTIDYRYSNEREWQTGRNIVYDMESKKYIEDTKYYNPYIFTILRPSYTNNTEFEYRFLMFDNGGNSVYKEGKSKISSLKEEYFE
ncbi:MAG: hypothetical protein WC849_01695 [Candidatus Paceibacterota bacterium]